MRSFVLSALAVASFVQAPVAFAHDGPRIKALENRVSALEAEIEVIYDRLDPRGPGPRVNEVNCMLVDSGYSKTFLGSGSTTIDAEYNARAACQKTVNASHCTTAVKCDSTKDNPYSPGAVCIVTDSGYGKTFKGEGSTPVAAEANAKAACQASVNASHCGGAATRCELK